MVCYQKLPSQNFIKTQKIWYGWCGIRGYYPMQMHWNTIKIRYGCYGIRNFNHINASNFNRKRCGWYFVRNFDPINELKLKNKEAMGQCQRLTLCNFMKAQQRYESYVIRNYHPRISWKYNKLGTDGMVLETAAL